MKREVFKSGAIWEDKVAYSRAIKVGNTIEVAGTVATDGEKVLYPGQAYEQACYILDKIRTTLETMGSGLEEVIRTRMFVVDIDQWEAIGKAHGEFFKGIDPVATMVEVSRLIDKDCLVEIEVSAIVHNDKVK